jgi:uncharacterized protein involved in exopolysaccharide biosynthesis
VAFSVTRYIETFFRHKVLLLTPVVLTLLVSVWYVSTQSKTYTATSSVWFDSQIPGPAYFDATGNPGMQPAQQAQTLLTQLLSTKDFVTKAANRAPLVDWARAHGVSPDQASTRLAGGVTAVQVGPQVMRLFAIDKDPTAATLELQAVTDEYFDTVQGIRSSRSQDSINYYQPRLDDAAKVKAQADAAQLAYLQAHPEAGAVGATDPTYASLVSAATTARQQYLDLQSAMTQAQQALGTEQTTAISHVIDPPGNAVASSMKKKAIFAGAAGLFFGLLLGLLGLIALTAADTAARRREDVEMTGDDLQVVATISHFPRSRPASGEASSQ